jgi:hypothetical protein
LFSSYNHVPSSSSLPRTDLPFVGKIGPSCALHGNFELDLWLRKVSNVLCTMYRISRRLENLDLDSATA